MISLIFNSLYIFECSTKKGKKIEFENGINIITSEQKTGNDKGKSILMKSLYHTLGGDSKFDAMWEKEDKIYLVNISIGEHSYFVYRSKKLFKIYDNDFKQVFSTINRQELAKYLSNLYKFKIQLPNRKDEKLELAPPVYSYLLNYIDQDYMRGSYFSSFNGLEQYSNFKENLIFSHFGIFKEEYFETLKNVEILKEEKEKIEDNKVIVENMLERTHKYLKGIDTPLNLKTLEIELNRKKDEYSEILNNLKKVKNNLVEIRNEKIDLLENIKDLNASKKINEKELESINHKLCPICSNEIEDLNLIIKKNSQLEDFFIMNDDLETLLLGVDRKLLLKENQYKELLKKLKTYEKKMKINDFEITSVIKHKGYLETQDELILELGEESSKLLKVIRDMKEDKKKIKEFNKLKKKANDLYEEYMLEDKDRFNLKEIKDENLKNIKKNIGSRGSNIPITTIIWYFNLLKIKYLLNKKTIKFPLVLDSPNNVELDNNKKLSLFTYIFENRDKDTQLIMSTLGFDKTSYKEVTIDKVIKLKNEGYTLLNKKDYEENIYILDKIFEQTVEKNIPLKNQN